MDKAGFHLTRYFALTSLFAFVLVSIALAYFEHEQTSRFREIQEKEQVFFRESQERFVQQQETAAKRNLLSLQENGNVTLTRLFANMLWARDIAPFMQQVAALPAESCRQLAEGSARKQCFAALGEHIRALPGFPALHARAESAMKGTSVFKIKVFDLHGLTVYSSEHAQVGEDQSGNAGWRSAARGQAASELTHRDRFSSFEGVVENRDLISSYLPLREPGATGLTGVFEIYADVTPFLARSRENMVQIRELAQQNLNRIKASAEQNHSWLERTSALGLTTVFALLTVLYVISFGIIRSAQNYITQQEQEREQNRHRLAQAEKMASLGQMVAGVSHQLNTPIAFSRNNVEMARDAIAALEPAIDLIRNLAQQAGQDGPLTLDATARQRLLTIDLHDTDTAGLLQLLDDVHTGMDQMAEMVMHLRNFTRLDKTRAEPADLNRTLATVVYIARSVIPGRISLIEDYHALPPVSCMPSQINQVFLNLINNAAQAITGQGEIRIRTGCDPSGGARIDIADTGGGIAAEHLPHIFDLYFTTRAKGEGTGLGLHIARDVIEQHGGRIEATSTPGQGSVFSVFLPPATQAMENTA